MRGSASSSDLGRRVRLVAEFCVIVGGTGVTLLMRARPPGISFYDLALLVLLGTALGHRLLALLGRVEGPSRLASALVLGSLPGLWAIAWHEWFLGLATCGTFASAWASVAEPEVKARPVEEWVTGGLMTVSAVPLLLWSYERPELLAYALIWIASVLCWWDSSGRSVGLTLARAEAMGLLLALELVSRQEEGGVKSGTHLLLLLSAILGITFAIRLFQGGALQRQLNELVEAAPSRAAWAALAFLAAVLTVFTGLAATDPELHRCWPSPSPHWPPFADLGVVLAAVDAQGQSLDPYRSSAAGTMLYNYPPCWLALGKLGLGFKDCRSVGTLLAGLFGASYVAFFRGARLLETLLAAVALSSSYVLLGVERGNIDLCIFTLLALALSFDRGLGGALLLGGVLKLFPCFGFPALFLARTARSRLQALGPVLVFTVYVAWLFWHGYLGLINLNTSRWGWVSYGWRVLATRLASQTAATEGSFVVIYGVVPLIVAALAIVWAVVKGSWGLRSLHFDQRHGRAFLVGAGIYCGTFLLGNNFCYRLVFLVFTVPQAVRWIRQGGDPTVWGVMVVGLVLFLLGGETVPPMYFTVGSWAGLWFFGVILGTSLRTGAWSTTGEGPPDFGAVTA